MPDQNMQNDAELSRDEIAALPVGAVVRDSDGDVYTRVAPAETRIGYDWKQNQKTNPIWNAGDIATYSPVTLVSLPDQPDLYQQARIALRDRLGTEPKIDDVHSIVRSMEHNDYTATEAITAQENLSELLNRDAPTALSQLAARHVDVSGLLDADFAVVVFVKDNDVAGLARLRAHAALDQLLDQHGVSR